MTDADIAQASPSVDLGLLPRWRGVEEEPDLHLAPFRLGLDELGVVRLDAPVVAEETVEEYGSEGYRFPTSPPGSSDWGNALAARSLGGLSNLAGRLDGLDVLEIGGGTLYSARHMLDRMGARTVTLVDPAARDDGADPRVRIVRSYFSAETDLGRRFDLVVSFNTLEHVPDPVDFLTGVHRTLADGGRAFIKVPDCERSLELGDLGMCTHEHLSYFTFDSLDVLFRRTGLEVVGQDNYLGALQILVRKTTPREAPPCRSTASLLAAFEKRSKAHIDRLRAFAKSGGRSRVAFVGASVGLCNVLHVSRIADALEVEIFDGDALKTGKYVPGCDRPIRLTSDEALEAHDTIFITPVNFFDEIRRELDRRPGLAGATIRPVFPATGG